MTTHVHGRRRRLWFASLFLCCGAMPVAGAAPEVAPAAATGLRVGYAERDITPKEAVPMWGYGARHAALSQGTLEPLRVNAVVLAVDGPKGDAASDQDVEKIAIVGLDLGRAPGEGALANIRQRIREKAGIGYSFISGSHTHHGPVLELTDKPGRGKGRYDAALRYYKQLEDAIVEAVLAADADLSPAAAAMGSAQTESLNRNRHSKVDPPVDRELAVMRFDDAATPGKVKAVVVNFAAHPTIVNAAGLRFSPDFVGPMRDVVAAELKCGVVYMQGAAGDLSSDRGGAGREGHDGYGRAVGREVVKLATSLEPRPVAKATLRATEEQFTFKSRVDFASPAVKLVYSAAFFPELVNNYLDEYAGGIKPRLTVATLGGEGLGRVALVGVSGEFFAAHSLRLKERLRRGGGVKQAFFFGYCNGYHQYFPTIEAAAQGGYGADPTVAPAELGAGERVMDAALVRVYEMTGRFVKVDPEQVLRENE